MTSIYFDTCALNRLTDDQTTPRLREEADAVQRLLDLVAFGTIRWVSSAVVRLELQRNPDSVRRQAALATLEYASEIAAPTALCLRRAAELAAVGFRGLDHLHLALAEQAKVDWFVTTDDRFLRLAARHTTTPPLEPANPVDLVQRRFPWPLPKP